MSLKIEVGAISLITTSDQRVLITGIKKYAAFSVVTKDTLFKVIEY